MNSFLLSSRIDNQNSGCFWWGGNKGWIGRNLRNLSGTMVMVCILTGVWVTQIYICENSANLHLRILYYACNFFHQKQKLNINFNDLHTEAYVVGSVLFTIYFEMHKKLSWINEWIEGWISGKKHCKAPLQKFYW